MERRFKSLTQLIVALLLLHVQPTLANAQELKVLCSVAFKDVLQEVAPLFDLATGHRIAANYDLANRLTKRVELGEHFDVVILTRNAVDDLTKSGKLIAASRRQIASVGIGVAVRKGAHKPDIRSTAELKQVLLNAKSIGYSKEGASGIYFAAVLERLGIAGRVRAKTKLVSGTSVAEFVGDGGAEIGVQMISEILPISSVVLAGPLPPELQKLTSFTAAIGTNAVSLNSANELVSFLVGLINAHRTARGLANQIRGGPSRERSMECLPGVPGLSALSVLVGDTTKPALFMIRVKMTTSSAPSVVMNACLEKLSRTRSSKIPALLV